MTEAAAQSPTPTQIPITSQRHLRIAEGSADLFPQNTNTLQPGTIQEHDRRALLIMGALGVQQSFDTLDNWLRFSHRETKALSAELERNPRSTYAAIQSAGRYAVARMNIIVPNYDHTGTPDPNANHYRKYPLFRELLQDAQANPLERRYQQRLHLGRISIFSEALFKATNRE